MSKIILLVEDSPDDVFFMKRALKLAGVTHALEVAEDGQQALDFLGGTLNPQTPSPRPDLALLDLRLPLVPGLDVLKWIRQQPAFECMPVVVLTSSKVDRDMQKAYALGANSFLVKPSDSTELVAMVKSLADYWLVFNSVPAPCEMV